MEVLLVKLNKYMRYFFTSDEHYGHSNIIKFSNRPFSDVKEMDEELIKRNNEIVGDDDIVVHAGDFTFRKVEREAMEYIKRLKGHHVFLKGNHDSWMKSDDTYHEIKEFDIEKKHIVVCHYSMRVWPLSHYNSYHLFGHSHGKLEGIGKSLDIGVDTHNYYPYSWEEIKLIMDSKEDNINRIIK